MSGMQLNAPIKSLIAGPGGNGYWLYAADGGVFSFGSAHFHGSTGGMRLNAPVVGMASTPNGEGYWLVASRRRHLLASATRAFHGFDRRDAPCTRRSSAWPAPGRGRGTGSPVPTGACSRSATPSFKGSASAMSRAAATSTQLVGMPDGNGYRMLALRNVARRRS